MGLGAEWEVSDVCFEERGGGADELHVRVSHVRGRAVGCPECGRRCGACDTRERTWHRLGVWQYETAVHCAVPRAGCPERGVRTVRTPWGARPSPRLTALFEAQVLAMALSGLTAAQIASALRMSDGTVWRMLRRAVAEARAAADYSAVERVGIDDTARRRGQSHVPAMVGLDARRVVAVSPRAGAGAPSAGSATGWRSAAATAPASSRSPGTWPRRTRWGCRRPSRRPRRPSTASTSCSSRQRPPTGSAVGRRGRPRRRGAGSGARSIAG